jgi:hypothetical protein
VKELSVPVAKLDELKTLYRIIASDETEHRGAQASRPLMGDSMRTSEKRRKTQIPTPNQGHPPCYFDFLRRSVFIRSMMGMTDLETRMSSRPSANMESREGPHPLSLCIYFFSASLLLFIGIGIGFVSPGDIMRVD